jgi:hypothetical protein
MLYKNDELYKMDDNERKSLLKFFHDKFPVKVVYPPERIVKSRLKHNRLPDKPNSISFDLVSTVRYRKTAEGKSTPIPSEIWRYATSMSTDKNGNKKYLPKKFKFNGARFLGLSDIELIFFLLRKSEFCKEGDNQGKIVKFMFEDLVSAAEKKAAKKSLAVKIDTLLYGEKSLPVKRLRELAKAMFVHSVDELSDAQVRIALDDKIAHSKDGVDKFLSMIDADMEISSRGSIQKVIDSGKLHYDSGKRTWFWKTENSRPEFICKVIPGAHPEEVLVELYVGDKSFRGDIDAFNLTGRKDAGKGKPSKEGKEKENDTGDNEGGNGE